MGSRGSAGLKAFWEEEEVTIQSSMERLRRRLEILGGDFARLRRAGTAFSQHIPFETWTSQGVRFYDPNGRHTVRWCRKEETINTTIWMRIKSCSVMCREI